MNRKVSIAAMFASLALAGSYLALAQNPQGQQPQQPMSFFVTSVGLGKGGDLGGLAGADAHCQMLAQAAGSTGKTWRAYLSTQPSPTQSPVNARDRIGSGPWYNAKGARIAKDVADLHGDTLDQARLGNNMGKQTDLNEKGQVVNGVGDQPNTHDMLTGSQPDGRAFSDTMDHTCGNWTSSTTGSAQVGHSDRNGGGNTSWNSAHGTPGCSPEALQRVGGAGLFYCFAIN